jgi:hypothetical protein
MQFETRCVHTGVDKDSTFLSATQSAIMVDLGSRPLSMFLVWSQTAFSRGADVDLVHGDHVPGEALGCLVITRLPFDVPSDPVFAARLPRKVPLSCPRCRAPARTFPVSNPSRTTNPEKIPARLIKT